MFRKLSLTVLLGIACAGIAAVGVAKHWDAADNTDHGRLSKEDGGRLDKEDGGRLDKEDGGRLDKEESGRLDKDASGRLGGGLVF